MKNDTLDLLHLHSALALAKLRKGFCSPNPAVGALIVNASDEIIAEGHHESYGSSHAEAAALQKLTQDPKGATLYVTLEPCCHWGKTPPCTRSIIEAGIVRVVYGFRDPGPKVNGKGELALRTAGIICEHVPIPEINDFYESYHYWHTHKKPWTTTKLAMSLDGKIAGPAGERVQITGKALQEFTHLSRKRSDAILTTIKTIIKDDPKLNVRLPNEIIKKPVYILDTSLNLPHFAALFKTAQSLIVFHSYTASPEKKEQLEKLGVRCVPIEDTPEGLNLQHVIESIGKDGVQDLWVEAGGRCISSLMHERLVQKSFILVAMRWFGLGQNAFANTFSFDPFQYQKISWKQFGEDVLCEVRW